MSHPARAERVPPGYDGHFVMIPLTRGQFAIADETDAELVGHGKWYALKSDRTWYAMPGRGQAQGISMHVLIAGHKGVDHVNRNGLDNRRINLRRVTPAQNSYNQAPRRNNRSGYKGVSWSRWEHKWHAQIQVNRRVIHLGRFDDPVEAARAYNRAAAAAFGEFAWLNPLPDAVLLSNSPRLRSDITARQCHTGNHGQRKQLLHRRDHRARVPPLAPPHAGDRGPALTSRR